MKKLILVIALGAIGFGASAQVKVSNSGNVGIGTITPAYSLDVLGSNGSPDNRNFRVLYKHGGYLTNTEFSALTYTTLAGGNNWTALYAKQGSASKAGVFDGDVLFWGNVGIGKATSNYKLDVSGAGHFGTGNGNGVIAGTYTCQCGYTRPAVYSNSNIYKLYLGTPNNWAQATYSLDIHYYNLLQKVNDMAYYHPCFNDNIMAKLDGIGLYEITDFRGFSSEQMQRYVFSADELQGVFPELVFVSDTCDGGDSVQKAINYIGMVPILTAGINEQQAEIKTLQGMVSELSDMVNEIQGNNENVEILGTLRVINHVDYPDIAAQISVNQDLTKAFLVTNTFAVADTNVFCIYGNGDVNAKKIYAEEIIVSPNAMNIFLPEILSEKEINKNGVNLLDMQGKLLMKIEELTLHIIEQQKHIEALQQVAFMQEVDLNGVGNTMDELQSIVYELQNRIMACCGKDDTTSSDNHKSNNGNYHGNKHSQYPLQQDKPILYQNTPNPFSSNTEISCDIPISFNSAFIYVYNLQGVELMSFPITQTGYSAVTVYASALPAGMYLYTLVVDGVIIDTKRMILTK